MEPESANPPVPASAPRRGSAVVGIGLDLVEVPRIRALLDKNGDRFRKRVFTEAEIRYCDSCAEASIHYAARFAAKEAVAKALGTGFAEGVTWTDIEVVRGSGGAPSVQLHGGAVKVAETLGGTRVLLTMTHTATSAAASALLLSDF